MKSDSELLKYGNKDCINIPVSGNKKGESGEWKIKTICQAFNLIVWQPSIS